ncbi:MAG TPA: hypothetical protein VKB89_04285 [Xanthobacteraceae bacterium]|nr:hypothetical protein [Xanthobacteraceae bacterium]
MEAGQTPLTGLELILPALFLASLFVSGWGWNAAWTEAEKSLPIEFRDEMYSLRFRIDPFMWGPSASRKGRRQYVATLGCFILGFACLPAFTWGRLGYPLAMLPSLMLAIVTGTFAWKCFQHWRYLK